VAGLRGTVMNRDPACVKNFTVGMQVFLILRQNCSVGIRRRCRRSKDDRTWMSERHHLQCLQLPSLFQIEGAIWDEPIDEAVRTACLWSGRAATADHSDVQRTRLTQKEAGRVTGIVQKKITSEIVFKGYKRYASKEEPQYIIKSDKTDHIAIHKGDGTIARIPLWMIDATVCAAHSVGVPEVSLAALKDLRQLLHALDQPQDGDARPNALRPEAEHEQSSGNESSASALAHGAKGANDSITSDSHE